MPRLLLLIVQRVRTFCLGVYPTDIKRFSLKFMQPVHFTIFRAVDPDDVASSTSKFHGTVQSCLLRTISSPVNLKSWDSRTTGRALLGQFEATSNESKYKENCDEDDYDTELTFLFYTHSFVVLGKSYGNRC